MKADEHTLDDLICETERAFREVVCHLCCDGGWSVHLSDRRDERAGECFVVRPTLREALVEALTQYAGDLCREAERGSGDWVLFREYHWAIYGSDHETVVGYSVTGREKAEDGMAEATARQDAEHLNALYAANPKIYPPGGVWRCGLEDVWRTMPTSFGTLFTGRIIVQTGEWYPD